MPESAFAPAAARDLLLFVRGYFARSRWRLGAVLALELLLASINGVGLLLILPLLGLLGFGSAGADSPLWRGVADAFARAGVPLTLANGLALFVAIIAARALLAYRRETWLVQVEQEFQTSLREQLYAALARTEFNWLQRLRTADFIQSTQTEIRQAQQAANALLRLVSQALNLAAYVAVALVLAFGMTLLTIGCGLLAMLLMLPVTRRVHDLSRRQIRVRSGLVNNLLEHIQGLRVARSLGLTGRFERDYRERSALMAAGIVRLNQLSSLSTMVFEIVAAVLLAVVVYVALARAALDPARFVVLLIVFVRIFPLIGRLQNQLEVLVGLVPSFRHYLELLQGLQQHAEATPPPQARLDAPLRNALELRDVGFRHAGAAAAVLDRVTLRLARGEVTVLAGHSGAGKSTLADIAVGLLRPDSGALVLDGVPLDDTGRLLWQRETALVPQDGFLFNDTIRANLLCIAPQASEAQLWQALDAAHCRGFVSARAGGLDGTVGERGALLSGGERQRLAIARALLRRPRLLVLDEPTNNLDAASVAALVALMRTLKQDIALLVVSHDSRMLEAADRVYRVDAGGVHAEAVRPGAAAPA